MNREEIRNKVNEIITHILSVIPDDYQGTDNLTYDLGADSFDLVEITMAIESAFGISIPNIEDNLTIDDIIILIEEKLK